MFKHWIQYPINTFEIFTACDCNLFGVYIDNWDFGVQKFNDTQYHCDDGTGDCGLCHVGFTGLKCDICANDFEYYDFYSYDYTEELGYKISICLKGKGFLYNVQCTSNKHVN